MEKESFEDAEIAALLNESFVSIKVDREERPDIDAIYMRAVQGMTGQGGWPMSVFLTPDGEPFYAGTYFPPRRQSGMPSFRDVLAAVLEAYRERRDDVRAAGEKVIVYLESQNRPAAGARALSADVMNSAYRALAATFDAENGGFGHAPKFPQPLAHEFLLRYWHRTGEVRSIAMAEITANRMARGGIYDQLGGGFHRYATDSAWLIPHFEKMLYDNALLGMLNLHMWQATGKDFFRRVTEETLAYVEREMLHPSGAFYSSQDADSEGEEGKFFVWEAAEVDRLLGPELSRVARAYYAITDAGNFDGRNVLSAPRDDEEVAQELDMPVEELREAVREARRRLWEAREKRVRPNTDDMAITSWNALMLKTFAEAGSALANRGLVDVAERNAEFILGSLLREGRLLRTWRASDGGGQAKIDGYLEDYACLVDGLLTLYEATFEYRWVTQAVELAGRMIELFWDAGEESFFDTAGDRKLLIVRPRNVFDDSHPSGQLNGHAGASQAGRLHRREGVRELRRPLAALSIRSDGQRAFGCPAMAGGAGFPSVEGQGDRRHRAARGRGDAAAAGRHLRPLPAEQGGRRRGDGARRSRLHLCWRAGCRSTAIRRPSSARTTTARCPRRSRRDWRRNWGSGCAARRGFASRCRRRALL